MLNRVLEIAEENRFLSQIRGFIVISSDKNEIGRVPLEDVAVLLLSAQSVVLTKAVVNSLSENGCITVFCGKNYCPKSMVIPIGHHSYHSKIIKDQISISLPVKKRIWQQIVIRKIEHQALALELCKKDSSLIRKISSLVKSGDPDNREAYAARMYWKELFGEKFCRDKNGDGINAFLNYGYAIMRAAMVRSICAHGLEPSLGIHHDNNLNSFCLADDLFEVFRPIVDVIVYNLWQNEEKELTPDVKKTLAELLQVKVKIETEEKQIVRAMDTMVISYVNALADKDFHISLPLMDAGEYGITIIE